MKQTKIDTKLVLKRASNRKNRIKVSFTFDEDLYKEFQETCETEDVAVSRVLEELMRDFLNSQVK